MIKIANTNIYYRILDYDAKLVRTVHDEISARSLIEISEGVKNIIEDEMIKAAQLFLKRIPVKVDSQISREWAH